MLFRIELPVPLHPERCVHDSTEHYPLYHYPTFGDSMLARTSYIQPHDQHQSHSASQPQNYGAYSLEVPTVHHHYKHPSASSLSISSHHGGTRHNTPRHSPLHSPLHTPIHTPRLTTPQLPTPGPSTPSLLAHGIVPPTASNGCLQPTSAIPQFPSLPAPALHGFPSTPDSMYEESLVADLTPCYGAPATEPLSSLDSLSSSSDMSFSTPGDASLSLSSSPSPMSGSDSEVPPPPIDRQPSSSQPPLASSSRSATPVISHQPPLSSLSQPVEHVAVSQASTPTSSSIDVLLDELTSSEAATPRECSHCKIRNSPLWRRHPETYALLCNACGLYLQANNELRPRRLIEDDEAPPPPTDGKVCSHCNTTATSVWRRGADGQMLCNACGVYYRLRGRARPLELRADRVKRRVQRSRKEK